MDIAGSPPLGLTKGLISFAPKKITIEIKIEYRGTNNESPK